MNHSEIIEILADVKEAFPMQPMEDSTVRLWTRTLGDLDFKVTRRVVDEWIMTEEFPPKIASIRNRVLQEASGLPTPGEAWLMVLQRMKSTYPGMPAEKWDAPREVQDALKDIGGMHLLRQIDRADDARKRFDKAYTERVDRSRRTTPELGPNAMKELMG